MACFCLIALLFNCVHWYMLIFAKKVGLHKLMLVYLLVGIWMMVGVGTLVGELEVERGMVDDLPGGIVRVLDS